MFVIEGTIHAQLHGSYPSFDAAMNELQRRSQIPYDQTPNQAPCENWTNCGREYAIVEYEPSEEPWRLVREVVVLTVSSAGIVWGKGVADKWKNT